MNWVTMIRRPGKPRHQNHRIIMGIPAHLRAYCKEFLRTIRNNSPGAPEAQGFTGWRPVYASGPGAPMDWVNIKAGLN
jgi:hypothetical protein